MSFFFVLCFIYSVYRVCLLFVFLWLVVDHVCCHLCMVLDVFVLLMSRKSSHGKESAVVVSNTPVSNRTRQTTSIFDPHIEIISRILQLLWNAWWSLVLLDLQLSQVSLPTRIGFIYWFCSKTPLRNSSKNSLQMHSTMELN